MKARLQVMKFGGTSVAYAASCVSLLAGQGSELAMVAAYNLAGALHRANGN